MTVDSVEIDREGDAERCRAGQDLRKLAGAAEQDNQEERTDHEAARTHGRKSLHLRPPRPRVHPHLPRFLRKDKDSTIREFHGANEKLTESAKEMEAKIKVLTEKANEKYKILREGTDRLTKK